MLAKTMSLFAVLGLVAAASSLLLTVEASTAAVQAAGTLQLHADLKGPVAEAACPVGTAADIACDIRPVIAESIPAWVLAEVFRSPVELKVVEVNYQVTACLHHVHQAEMIERGVLLLESGRKIDVKRGGAGKSLLRFLP